MTVTLWKKTQQLLCTYYIFVWNPTTFSGFVWKKLNFWKSEVSARRWRNDWQWPPETQAPPDFPKCIGGQAERQLKSQKLTNWPKKLKLLNRSLNYSPKKTEKLIIEAWYEFVQIINVMSTFTTEDFSDSVTVWWVIKILFILWMNPKPSKMSFSDRDLSNACLNIQNT